MRKFDRKFGKGLIASVPADPGVYRMVDEAGAVVYVGKAKNLRRRLGQYRNAKRSRRDRKMRKIVEDASRIEWTVCPSELEAFLLETRLIQDLRPRWNIAGAFSFLYPMIGLAAPGSRELRFCFTTLPERNEGFSFHGAFRSREISGEAFFGLMRLFNFIGHPLKRTDLGARPERSFIYGFRQVDAPGWMERLDLFFRGESIQALENVILEVVENAAARRNAAEIQEDIDALKRFFKHEARRLRVARHAVGVEGYPVPQRERDPLFLRFKKILADDKRNSATIPAGSL